MRKALLLTVLFAAFTALAFAQTDRSWSAYRQDGSKIATDKSVARLSFPKEFKLNVLNIDVFRQQVMSITGKNAAKHSTVITLPNADGGIEQFEIVEASNFEPALQAQFPQIRAFSGRGITDKASSLKLDISPRGVHGMIFRTERVNEFLEPYSSDHTVYASYKSYRTPGQLPWTCTTEDKAIESSLRGDIGNTPGFTQSSSGELKTMRLAQSCNGEYSNYFNAFSSADVALVLAAYNTTLTRCNGVYEKDLALHLNLIPETVNVIFYDPATDPYTNLNSWNGQLQSTLTSIIGEANYDIGHMFGASGGGGNAGCIGCVCVNGSKGSGITSPADGHPEGDNFDIDYVVHEIGHQLGANHTFSMSLEGTGVNKEVGSGITIMGYAGITSYDVAPHSIDIYHEASIQQIQTNLAGKTCPVTTVITPNNATPVANAGADFTIPKSTPFMLNGSATDANAADVLTYCWEQNDNSTTTGANSVAIPTKATGPNWLSFSPTTNPSRTCPRLSTVLAGLFVTPTLGGDAIANVEALSSVARTLNFRLTVRDNVLYSSTAPIKVGQTAFDDMVVTVDASTGPFMVTAPNTNVDYPGGSQQTITWDVAGTTGSPINCANVKISLSTDGGLTFPAVLAASTANDGSELLTIPATPTTTARIKIESIGNIFFDISNSNFVISAPLNEFNFVAPATVSVPCNATSTTITLATTSTGGYVVPVNLSATAGVPTGATVTFAPATVVPGNSSVITIGGISTLAPGTYNITVTGVSGTITKTQVVSFTINPGTPPTISTAPTNQAVCVGLTATFTVATSGTPATGYQWQVSTNGGTSWANVSTGTGGTTVSYTTPATTVAMSGYQYRVIASSQCAQATSTPVTLTVNVPAAITTQPASIAKCAGDAATFSVIATGTNVTYQWQVSTDGTTWTNVSTGTGGTTATYTTPATTGSLNNTQYRVIVTSPCATVNSSAATLTVNIPATITAQPVSVSKCAGESAIFAVTATGTNVTYQWQISVSGGPFLNVSNSGPYSGATTNTLTITNPTTLLSGAAYRVLVNGVPCGDVASASATLTVNPKPTVELQLASYANITPYVRTTLTSVVSPPGTYTYQWLKNNVLVSGVTTPVYPVSVDDFGSYQVVATNNVGCSDTSGTVVLADSASNILFIYPNPTSGKFQVRYYNRGGGTHSRTLTVYDSKGAQVRKQVFSALSGAYARMDVDLSNEGSGIYFVVVSDASNKRLATGQVTIVR